MVTLFVQNNIQKPERKIRSESRDIDENDIVQWLGETFGIFRRLAAEWHRLMFVDDVIGNMAIATSVDARGDSSHRKRRVLRRLQCVVGIYFIMICECARSCKFYQKMRLASGFKLTKSKRTITLQDVQPHNVTSGRPYATAEVTILVREYPENYQK